MNKQSNQLYQSYVDTNNADVNQSKIINDYVSQGDKGFKQIEQIADKLKKTAGAAGLTLKEATATIRTQVSRALNKLDTGLSLQGLGEGQEVKIKAKAVQEEKEGVIAEVSEKPENSVNPETLSITHEQAWDFVEKYYTLDDVQALLGAVKARVASQLAEEVPAIANEVMYIITKSRIAP